MTDTEDIFGEVISMYTSEQAIEDGILFSLKEVLQPEVYEKSLLQIVTTNLMSKGYFKYENKLVGYPILNTDGIPILDTEGNEIRILSKIRVMTNKPNVPNVFDLLNQVITIIKNKAESDGFIDTFYACEIELPSGEQTTVWVEANELGGMTILLPEDH